MGHYNSLIYVTYNQPQTSSKNPKNTKMSKYAKFINTTTNQVKTNSFQVHNLHNFATTSKLRNSHNSRTPTTRNL